MIPQGPTKVSVFASCRTSANIPFGRFITAPVSVLWRPILKFSPHLADYSSKNQFPRKSSRTRECRGHVIFLREYMVEETNPVFSPPFFLLLRSTGSAAQKKEFEREFSERKKNEIFAIRVRRIISSILAGLVSSGRKDRASFPNGSGTIYECVNLSPEGFLRWTGNEPCETAFPNDFQTTTIRRGPSRPTTRYKFVCPVFWPHLPCIIREHSCERSANAAADKSSSK